MDSNTAEQETPATEVAEPVEQAAEQETPATEAVTPAPEITLESLAAQLAALQAALQPTPAPEAPAAEQPDPAARVAELERELANERAARMRLKVATAHKLPEALAARLQGTTEDELNADAESLVQLVRANSGPGVPPPGSTSTQRRPITAMTPAEIRDAFTKGLL